MDDETPDFVLATYKEIAARFGLGAPSAARVKAKRAGWITELPNHPADPRRIRVSREAWEKAAETPKTILNPPPRRRGISVAFAVPRSGMGSENEFLCK